MDAAGAEALRQYLEARGTNPAPVDAELDEPELEGAARLIVEWVNAGRPDPAVPAEDPPPPPDASRRT